MKFEDFYNKVVCNEEVKISHEMISFQSKDDKVIIKLNELFNNIRKTIVTSIVVQEKWFTDTDIKSYIREIENTIQDRFGIPVTIVNNTEGRIRYYAASPNKNSVLNNKYLTFVDGIKEIIKNKNISYRGKDDVDRADINTVFPLFIKSINNITNSINLEGVKVDLEKAYISGLPKEYTSIIEADLWDLLVKQTISPETITALFIREVGSIFVNIETSYKVARECSVLTNTLIDNLHKKGKPVKDTLLLIGSQLMANDSVTRLRESKEEVVAVEVIKSLVDNAKHKHARVDTNQLADQFATRFNLGTLIADYYVGDAKRIREMEMKEMKIVSVYGWAILSIILAFILFIVLVTNIPATVFVISLVASCIMTLLVGFFSPGYDTDASYTYDNELSYDDNLQRINRIKNDYVRKIRMGNLDKEAINSALFAIDKLTSLVTDLSEPEPPMFEFFKKFFSANYRSKAEMWRLEQELENIMENNLHTASARVKTML